MPLPDCVPVAVSVAFLLLNVKRDIHRKTGKIISRVCLWLGFGSRLIVLGGSSLGVVPEKPAEVG